MSGGVRWITAFIDTVEDRAEEVEVFWARITGQVAGATSSPRCCPTTATRT